MGIPVDAKLTNVELRNRIANPQQYMRKDPVAQTRPARAQRNDLFKSLKQMGIPAGLYPFT